MASKNLCFKLMREDVKRRSWILALTVLGFLFSILIPIAIKSGEFMELTPDSSPYLRKGLTNTILSLLGVNGFAIAVILTAAVLWAVSGFQYLHNSRKVDFYHSLPVKRYQLFGAVYINGIVIPALIHLVALVPSVILALRAGVGADVIGLLPWKGYLLHTLYYVLMYTTTVIAMMLTGNVVVALLGTVVFCGYGPLMVTLIYAYFDMSFHTFEYSEKQAGQMLRVIIRSSPFASYMGAIENFASGNWIAGELAGVLAVTILLAAGAWALYLLRPSEAAGKAMAFKKTQMPIKVLLVIPASASFGMFFYALRGTAAWLVFGSLCGSVLSHCLMEIIYHFDFRKLFAHRLCLAACAVVSVGLMTVGYYDWYGYDSWIPDGSKVESAAVILSSHDSWVSYGGVEKVERAYGYDNGDCYYEWKYVSPTTYGFEHMELTDIEPVLELARKGVEAERQRGGREEDYGLESYTIQYRMASGRESQRTYRVPKEEGLLELYRRIHDNMEYKQGTYPILEQAAQDTAGVYFQKYGLVHEVGLDEAQKGLLLNVYQEEWAALDMETRRRELPIGSIQFRTTAMQRACEENDERRNSNSYLLEHGYYPVYPSFTKTLEILSSHGIDVTGPNGGTFSKISIYYYEYYEALAGDDEAQPLRSKYAGKTVDYEKAEELVKLAPALCSNDDYDMGGYYYDANLYETADVKAVLEGTTKTVRCHIDLNRLSPEDAREYGFGTAAE